MADIPLLSSILDVVKAAAPLVLGQERTAAAVALSQSVVKLIDDAKDEFGPNHTKALDEHRAAFEASVNAHVDNTVAKLRG